MDAAEYKHIVLGLIFLKYISDAFLELHQKLKEGKGAYEGPEDKNEYTAEKVFYVPPSSRWNWLQGRAKLPTIGIDVDEAMDAIEKDNSSLRGVLPKVIEEMLYPGIVGVGWRWRQFLFQHAPARIITEVIYAWRWWIMI